MKLGRSLVALALTAGIAAPIVTEATAQPAAALSICLPCLTAGGNLLSGNIIPGPDGFDYHTQVGPPGDETLIHIYGHISFLPILPPLPAVFLPTIALPAL